MAVCESPLDTGTIREERSLVETFDSPLDPLLGQVSWSQLAWTKTLLLFVNLEYPAGTKLSELPIFSP
jgi:hypothetical protein